MHDSTWGPSKPMTSTSPQLHSPLQRGRCKARCQPFSVIIGGRRLSRRKEQPEVPRMVCVAADGWMTLSHHHGLGSDWDRSEGVNGMVVANIQSRGIACS